MKKQLMFALMALIGLEIAPLSAFASLGSALPLAEETTQPTQNNLVLIFPIDVDLANTTIEIFDKDRKKVPIKKPELSDNNVDVNVPLTGPLEPGVYTVKWKAISKGGKRVKGTYNFHVDP